jgi:hypothetical protein
MQAGELRRGHSPNRAGEINREEPDAHSHASRLLSTGLDGSAAVIDMCDFMQTRRACKDFVAHA